MHVLRGANLAALPDLPKKRAGVGQRGVQVIRILFAKWLDEKSFRERRRITLSDVCAETGLSRPTVSRIANVPGYVTSTEVVEKLCRYFGCTPGDLLVLVDEEPDGRSS